MPSGVYPRRVKRHAVIQPLDDSYRLIPLTQQQNAIVDAADFKWLSQWSWFAWWCVKSKTFYVVRNSYKLSPFGGKKRVTIRMHREILICNDHEDCDHKNFNGLDNRRQNLRRCTRAQNGMHKKILAITKSSFKTRCIYKGVYPSSREKWAARIGKNKKHIHLGTFNSKEDAARAYDVAALKYHGEFAHLNFPDS